MIELPVPSTISLLPVLVTSSAPATTPACGTLSRSCSSLRRATIVRGRPRTIAFAETHSWRSPLKSMRHGPGHVLVTPSMTPVSVLSAFVGS